MKRVLLVAVALVVLLTTFGTAFAQEPSDAVLGEVWWFWGAGFDPVYDVQEDLWYQQRVDMYLYRPSTLAGWPADMGGPNFGTFFAAYPESVEGWPGRRQSWPTWQYADWDGFYYAEFMLPRDEAWYPCSYPYKWNCNFVVPTTPVTPPDIYYHSPVWQDDFELGLAWPYYDALYYALTDDFLGAWAMANPQDTVAPMQAIMLGETGMYYEFDFEVIGYYWKWTDLPEDFYWVPVP